MSLFLSLVPEAHSASPGEFDSSFTPNGIVLTALSADNSPDFGDAVAVQPDGKIVTVGRRAPFTGTTSSAVIRYNADGSIDTSFGVRGVLLLTLGSGNFLNDVAVQPDGKIVAVGGVFNAAGGTGADMLVVRFNPNGSYDSSFNFNGWIFTDFAMGGEEAWAVAIQADGRVVVGGTTLVGSFRNYAFARYNSDGSLDQSFGSGGKVVQSGNTFNGDDIVFDLAVQQDGKIVGAGVTNSSGSSSNCFGLIRLNADGTLDSGFGTAGLVKTLFDEGQSFAQGLSLQPDGRIAVGGTFNSLSDGFAAARYNPDGTLDSSFDADGKVTTPIPNGAAGWDSTLQPDGKLILAGFAYTNAVALVRYNVDGSLDGSFGEGGVSRTSLGGFDDKALGIALLTDGKILATGHSGQQISDRDIVLVRYLADGTIDRSFGSPGRVHTSIVNKSDTAFDVVVQPDGKILAAGTSRNLNFREDLAVVRYLESGAIDTTFGNGGRVVVSMNSTIEANTARILLQPNGKMVVGSIGQVNGEFRIVLARLNGNGTPDDTFGSFGQVILGTGTVGASSFFEDMALQPDGKIVLGCFGGNPFDFVLIRLNSDGSPDSSFDTDGRATVSLSAGEDRLYGLAIQSDGKILAAGQVSITFGDSRIGLARFNSDGSLDTSFGMGGTTVPSLGNRNISTRAVVLQGDGRIVVGGANQANFAAARFNPDGSLDISFDGDGLSLIPVAPGANTEVRDLVIQRDGKIVLAGFSFPMSEFDFAVVRLSDGGSIDPTFDGDGIFNPELGNQGEAAYGITLQRDGKIVIGGGINEFSRRTFAILRLTGDSTGAAPFDFDGDGKTDIGIYRPNGANESEWWINRSATNTVFSTPFGAATDKVVSTDFTGDGKADVAFWRPSTGYWYVLRSEDLSYYSVPFGSNGDIPVPADYDGDGKADRAVFRPSNTTWYIDQTSGGTRIEAFGATGDKPVPADYDGDGKADIAIFRPTGGSGSGEWWINRSTAGLQALVFGVSTDKPIQGDYTGDGKADIAFWRPSTGDWYVLRSENLTYYSTPFGASTDIPTPGDYDGDGKFDTAVYRPSETNWYVQRTTAGTLIRQFGSAGDQPIPNAFVP
ncbi:MAG TPA: FG-GAP-like repeat-containing protein [Pyrinomonadaceae bacterium]|nr:FG-GAP-like repeat-containing protein [Pyrinomonadaceae bacterium]